MVVEVPQENDWETRLRFLRKVGWPLVPIMPRTGIYLSDDNDHGDQRFAACFRAAWKHVPYGVRRRMIKYWHTGNAMPFPYPRPFITLGNAWPDRNRTTIGSCIESGHVLRFHAPVVHRMPDSQVKRLVLHELAHVVQYMDDEMPTRDLIELDVAFILDEWGISEWRLNTWLMQNRSQMRCEVTVPPSRSQWIEVSVKSAVGRA